MKASNAVNVRESRLSLRQVGIIVLTLAAAFIHGVLLNRIMGKIDPLFTLNALGYLALLAALFLPQLSAYHNLVRWALIAFTAVTIVAWVIIGERDLLGYSTQLVELALIGLLFVDGRR